MNSNPRPQQHPPDKPSRTEPVELIVFDWDGTLMDSTGAIAQSICDAAADVGLKVPTREQAAYVIGLGLQDALRSAVPDLTPEQTPLFTERYRVHFARHHAQWQPFDGIPQMLAALAVGPVPLAIATGKSRRGLDEALQGIGWQGYFATSRCADEGEPKPHPWMLHDICEQMIVPVERVVMIGDTTHDLKMAQAAGADAIAVTYGAHHPDQLRSEPTLAVIDNVPELHGLLERLARAG